MPIIRLLCVVTLSGALFGCAHQTEMKSVETHASDTLSYTAQIDTTRLERGTGLQAVAAVGALVEQNLGTAFKVHPIKGATSARREIIAESPAPGYGVRVVIEERPDQFCFVTIDVVGVRNDGSLQPVALAPYSVHAGVKAMRDAMASLRAVNHPPLTTVVFDDLRAQAVALAKRNADPAISETTFVRTPRRLERGDEPLMYYAPTVDEPSHMRER